ncbi:MAG: hypothetical protein WBB82_03065 [Limnothrix sp.]
MNLDHDAVTITEQVKEYLAYWFQVGKPVILPSGDRQILPNPVVVGDRYSAAFEACWQELLQPQNRDAYLEGTDHTIESLLSGRWDISSCARCAMPVPIDNIGLEIGCPCADLDTWPNVNVPIPHSLEKARDRLSSIQTRLQRGSAGLN